MGRFKSASPSSFSRTFASTGSYRFAKVFYKRLAKWKRKSNKNWRKITIFNQKIRKHAKNCVFFFMFIKKIQFQWQLQSWALWFHHWLKLPPTHPLNPINPDNARILRITAAAGTELADAFSSGTCKQLRVVAFTPRQKKFTIHRTVFLHATWLVQASAHWPIFLTAASRRSLVRVSVPMWGTFLSEPLSIVDLVSRYLTNYLMERMPIRHR